MLVIMLDMIEISIYYLMERPNFLPPSITLEVDEDHLVDDQTGFRAVRFLWRGRRGRNNR